MRRTEINKKGDLGTTLWSITGAGRHFVCSVLITGPAGGERETPTFIIDDLPTSRHTSPPNKQSRRVCMYIISHGVCTHHVQHQLWTSPPEQLPCQPRVVRTSQHPPYITSI
uniref:Uncharacterized protein n=1 Tax=Branchiostoma floridae TaxID=7739 RepID=C3ZVC7_BRAFL|eukprot:XP_002587506.1 hypothetical protein BRAFLDRAFT_99396 [Branchiostoma floridae]